MDRLSPSASAHDPASPSIAGCDRRKSHASTRPARLVQHRPLRIVRILEVGQTPAQVGRMVISGRMADVCAELDRLAASEAARH